MADDNLVIEETVRTYLASHGGSVEDPSGRGLTDDMARAIGVERPFTLNAVLRQMEGNGVITRDVRGLLTYRIALVAGDDPGQAPPVMATANRKNGATRTAPTAATPPAGLVEPGAETVSPSDAPPPIPVAEPVAAEPVLAAPVAEPVAEAGAEPDTAALGAEAAPHGPDDAGSAGPLAAPAVAETVATDAIVAGSGAEATDQTQPPAEDKPVSLREALARRGKPPKGGAPAVSASAGPTVTSPVDTTANLIAVPQAATPADITATLPAATPATTADETTVAPPDAASVASPPPAVADSDSTSSPPPAAPLGGPPRAVTLREALAAKNASAREGADIAPPPPGASTEAPLGPSGTPPFGSSTVAPTGSAPPAGGSFVSLRDSAPPPPPPVIGAGAVSGTSAATSTAGADTATRAGGRRGARLRSRLDMPVQEVKAPPSKSTITAVAVAVAGLVLIAVISAIVSRTTNHPSPNNSFSASTDACHVVTAADASAVLGGNAGQPHFVLGTCVYDNGSSELIVAVFRQQARAMFDADRSSSAQDINGIGDAAYYVDGRLRVLKGNNLLELTESPIPQNAPAPMMLALASTAVGRL